MNRMNDTPDLTDDKYPTQEMVGKELEDMYKEDKQRLTEVYGELLLMISETEGNSYSYTYGNAVTPQGDDNS